VDGSAVAVVAFAVGTAGNSVKAVPQFLRTALHGRVAGLSPTAVWLAFTANVLWLCFGFAIEDWWLFGLGVLQTALTGATTVRFVKATGLSHNLRQAAVALPCAGVLALLAVTGSGLVLESLGAALGVVIGAPQLIYLLRRRRSSTDVSGVAQAEYVVVVVAQVAWTTYWLTQGHPVAAAGAAWGGTARAATVWMLRQQRARV
jgi:uncharacterized protein with PQ loop repeat